MAREVMSVDSVNVVDSAKVPTNPSGPKRPLYIAVGLLAGLFAAVAIVVVADMLNTKVRGRGRTSRSSLASPSSAAFPP